MDLSVFIIKICKNLQLKMVKVSRGLSPKIVNELFQFREQICYKLRQRPEFLSGTESLIFLGSKVWALAPNEMKQ